MDGPRSVGPMRQTANAMVKRKIKKCVYRDSSPVSNERFVLLGSQANHQLGEGVGALKRSLADRLQNSLSQGQPFRAIIARVLFVVEGQTFRHYGHFASRVAGLHEDREGGLSLGSFQDRRFRGDKISSGEGPALRGQFLLEKANHSPVI